MWGCLSRDSNIWSETAPHFKVIMFRLKIIKKHPKYTVGQTIEVSRNEAFGLLDSGYAKKTKDMVAGTDYRTKKK